MSYRDPCPPEPASVTREALKPDPIRAKKIAFIKSMALWIVYAWLLLISIWSIEPLARVGSFGWVLWGMQLSAVLGAGVYRAWLSAVFPD